MCCCEFGGVARRDWWESVCVCVSSFYLYLPHKCLREEVLGECLRVLVEIKYDFPVELEKKHSEKSIPRKLLCNMTV